MDMPFKYLQVYTIWLFTCICNEIKKSIGVYASINALENIIATMLGCPNTVYILHCGNNFIAQYINNIYGVDSKVLLSCLYCIQPL